MPIVAVMTVKWLTAFLDFPAASFETGATFWSRVTGSSVSAARGERGQFATLIPPEGDPFLRLQQNVLYKMN